MSTSARIIIRTATALWSFDKWHDGYPDHTMTTLQAFLEDVQKNGPPADPTEAASRLNQADYPNHPDSRDDIEISRVYKTDGPANPISLRDPDRMAWDRYDRNYYYLVDLASQTPTAQESPETPQDAAARFWKWIKDGQGETDGAEIETWLQENTPEGDHRRETRSAILAGAEPMNHPTLTPRFTEQDLRDILGDTQKDLLAAWKRAETAEEMLDESEINPETGNPWKEDYEDKVDELEEAEEAKVNPETGNIWEEDYYDEKEERERLEEELEKAEEKEQEAREAQAAAEAERDQARQDHERTLDRLTRAEIRAAELEKEVWEEASREKEWRKTVEAELATARQAHAAATKAGADLLRHAQDQRDEARRDRDHYRKELINALEDYRRAAAERNKHEDDQTMPGWMK